MTRADVLKALGWTPMKLADELGIGRTTVSNWGDDAPLPRGWQFEIAYRYPETGLQPEARFFAKSNNNRQRGTEGVQVSQG